MAATIKQQAPFIMPRKQKQLKEILRSLGQVNVRGKTDAYKAVQSRIKDEKDSIYRVHACHQLPETTEKD